MLTIDADTHVIETEQTWAYLSQAEQSFQPRSIRVDEASGMREYWVIDGMLQPRRANIGPSTTEATRELSDVEARLRHMDKLGVDVQVLYPTIFQTPVTRTPEIELGLCRSYNRWLADIWDKARGRLAWVALLPFMSMGDAMSELRWVKDHGACAVYMRGLECGRRPADPYFDALYRNACDLDIALAFHAAIGDLHLHEMFGSESFANFKFPVLNTFWSMVSNGIPDRFPTLRVGFIEASAQWVPYLMHHLALSLRNRGKSLPAHLLEAQRLYVACQTDDDLSYVLGYAGEDNLLIGSDYGHADTSSELEALRNLKREGKLPAAVVDKILGANPARFYGLGS